MKKLLNNIFRFLLVVIAVTMTIDVCGATNWDKDVDKRKAAYIFLEATKHYEQDNVGSYYSLLNRAYELDTTDTSVGFEKGMMDMILNQNDSVEFFKAHALSRRHFDSHPEDYYSSIKYGMITDKIGWRDESVRVWRVLDSIFTENVDITLRYADALSASIDSAEIAKAVATYNRIEVAEGKDAGITSRKIRAYSAIKDTANIVRELTLLLESSPNNSDFNVFAGEIYNYLGDDEKALEYLNKACTLDPSNGKAFFERANFYKEIGDSVAYDQAVFNVLKHDELDLDAKLQLLTGYIRALYADSTQQTRIEELLMVLQEQHPHQYKIHELYGAYLATIKDFPRAAEQLSYALDIDPSSEQVWSQLIALSANTDNRKLKVDAIERALHYFPQSPMLIYQSGLIYSVIEEPEKAMECFYKALPLSDYNHELKSDILCSMADSYYKNAMSDSAFVYYGKAIEVNPDNMLALNNYAYYLSEKGIDLDRAERMSARTVVAEPENVNSLDTYAWIFFKKKNYDMARKYIETALKYSEKPSAELNHHAGDIYFMSGDPQKALEYWKEALKLEPENELLKKKVKHKTYFYE